MTRIHSSKHAKKKIPTENLTKKIKRPPINMDELLDYDPLSQPEEMDIKATKLLEEKPMDMQKILDFYIFQSHLCSSVIGNTLTYPTARELAFMAIARSAGITRQECIGDGCLTVTEAIRTCWSIRHPDSFYRFVSLFRGTPEDKMHMKRELIRVTAGPLLVKKPTESMSRRLLAEAANTFYWAVYWGTTIGHIPNEQLIAQYKEAHPSIQSLENTLDQWIRVSDKQMRIAHKATAVTKQAACILDARLTMFRFSVDSYEVDSLACIRLVSVKEDDASKAIVESQMQPHISPEKREPKRFTEVWKCFAFAYIFSQKYASPPGMPASFALFVEWYVVFWHEIGSTKFHTLMRHTRTRFGIKQRPFIIQFAEDVWIVSKSPDRHTICRGFVHALHVWWESIHSAFDGYIETGAKLCPLPTDIVVA